MTGPLRPDVAIIGSGPGGYRAAVLAALRGLKVVIIEKQTWGGTCLNRGCVPKKAWYHTARIVADGANYSARGITGVLTANFAQAWRHQRTVVETVRASYVDYLRRLGVVLLKGAARFTAATTLQIGTQVVTARHVIIATGSRPWLPPSLPLTVGKILTTDELFDDPPPPGRRVAVLGSGAVGTEMAFILSRLGLEVTWLTGREPLTDSRFGASARKVLHDALAAAGVAPHTGTRILAAECNAAGVALHLPGARASQLDWVLAGTGRVPNTQGLDVAKAGVTLDDRGYVVVDACNRAARGVYAIGDVANPAMSANHALADATIAVANILEPGSRRRDDARVPEAIYSALELARVGVCEDDAEARGLESAVGFAAYTTNPQALAEGDNGGFVRIIADMDTGHALGAEIAGRGAAELISLLGVTFGTPHALSQWAGAAYNHPTRSEELLNAVDTLAARWGLAAQIYRAPAGG